MAVTVNRDPAKSTFWPGEIGKPGKGARAVRDLGGRNNPMGMPKSYDPIIVKSAIAGTIRVPARGEMQPGMEGLDTVTTDRGMNKLIHDLSLGLNVAEARTGLVNHSLLMEKLDTVTAPGVRESFKGYLSDRELEKVGVDLDGPDGFKMAAPKGPTPG